MALAEDGRCASGRPDRSGSALVLVRPLVRHRLGSGAIYPPTVMPEMDERGSCEEGESG